MIKVLHLPLAAVLFTVLSAASPLRAEQQNHQGTGIVLKVQRAHHSLVISCDEVPGYMSAMEMSFSVRDLADLKSIRTGMPVRFTMVQRGKVLYAYNIQATIGANLESEPMDAGALSTLQATVDPNSAAHVIAQGQYVPDFELTDQAGKQVRLSGFTGKVVLLTFGYSRCPNPEYCLRLSNNLGRVRDRFAVQSSHDLVLLTIAIDPEYDKGAILSQYAAVWKADPANWHFLTGSLPEIKRVAAMFGMNFWRSEGLLTHSLHTVIINRSGQLAANLEGNQFTVRQLGDLVQTIMDRPQ
jgi:protein SCO1/2